MAHQLQLKNSKYRHWVKAGLGLRYLQVGLAPFCQEISEQQLQDILAAKALPPHVTCGTCQLGTLQPDHVNVGNKACPYGQTKCNCWFPRGKLACPNNICGAIYDHIVKNHASTPPLINWKNTDSQLWTSDPWSIAKCFINAPGYDQTTSAADTDCLGLLHVIMNNQYFHTHIASSLTGTNIFSTVRNHRHTIFHSSNQELEEATANSFIDDMVLVLQDGQVLGMHPDAQRAVLKLQELKNKEFIITSESHEELLKQIREDLMHELNELKSTVATKDEVEKKISNIDKLLKQTREDLMQELKNLRSTVSSKEDVEELDKKISNEEVLLKQTKSDTESTKELLKQTKNETESTKELLKQTKNDTESTKELLKQTKDEMVKSTNAIDEKCEGNKYNIEKLMSGQEEILKRLPGEEPLEQKRIAYENIKAEWRNKLIQEYQNTVLKVPVMPLLPYDTCEFSNTYVRPEIVSEIKSEKGKIEDVKIKSMADIFNRNGVPLKSVYVVGDAGTGKSSFCNYLVNCWCKAHSEEQIVKDDFDGVNEMKKFDFLFLIPLRNCQNIDDVEEMLKNQYNLDILGQLLENESANMIILLDGLDEWSSKDETKSPFQTMGLPKRNVFKKYTIVTTSRPWKIHTLKIRDTEIQQMLKLEGFDCKSENEMIMKTVSSLNSTKGESKSIIACQSKLREKHLRSLKHIPIMLQQLVCLWFDGNLNKTSRCSITSEMLELFFTWNDDKTKRTTSGNIEDFQHVELPECFVDKEQCDFNSHHIYDMSRLAYETLFNCSKDKSLTFENSIFRKLEISDERRESWLKLGILKEDRCPSLSASKRPKPMFSFIHKSVQEFLAAVNIAISFNTKISSSNISGNVYLQIDCIPFLMKVLKNCSTINEILEQSNIIIMLSGLEPRLATQLSTYVYETVKEDTLVKKYRRTVDTDVSYRFSDYRCIRDIQSLIFDSMNECNACCTEQRQTFNIGDLYIGDNNEYCDIVCSSIDQQQITLDSVHSIYVEDIDTENVGFLKYLPKFKHLEKNPDRV